MKPLYHLAFRKNCRASCSSRPDGTEQLPAHQQHLPLSFVCGHTHWYGYLEHSKLYYVVAGVWAIHLPWSPIWLRRFQFGPVERLWRSLTYWHRQPMRLPTSPHVTLEA